MQMIQQIEGLDSAFKEDLARELDIVSSALKKRAMPKYKGIKHIVMDVIENNGKMMRPLLTIVAAKFGDYDSKKVVNVATGIEMLHMATLVHDDIIDDADQRRGQPSVQSKYGKDLAVYAGDFLLAKALRTASSGTYEQKLIDRMSDAIEKICESELMQYQNRYKVMTLKNYLRVIAGKTAALFAVSMYAGAVEGGVEDKLARTLGRIGYEIGMAFQMIDDTLDFSTDTALVGKTTGNDLTKGYYTLPVIMALEKVRNRENLSREDIEALIVENQGLEKSKVLANKYTQKAFKRIDKLPPCPSKDAVEGIAKLLLNRAY